MSGSTPERRMATMAAHLRDGEETAKEGLIVPWPTAGVAAASVFEHIQQAPEDPILGVCFLAFHSSSPLFAIHMILSAKVPYLRNLQSGLEEIEILTPGIRELDNFRN
jgi:hypothetical protein